MIIVQYIFWTNMLKGNNKERCVFIFNIEMFLLLLLQYCFMYKLIKFVFLMRIINLICMCASLIGERSFQELAINLVCLSFTK